MAYLNFQNCTRQEYENTIYSGDARNKLKLLFNNVELEEADRYCEKMTIKSRIVPNGAKIFSLNNFISKEAELILHDIDTSIIQDQVSISIGTLVGNNYEYVPIGIFNIENQPTNDKNKTTIKLRDNSVKFDFNYNAQPLIEENGGSATKLQILQDICTQAGVTCNITSFIGYLDEIGIYDNTVTARKYIADIAEQAGKIATINRSGELIFIDLNNLTTWEIPIEIVEKYESGTKFKVGKVVYEDGIVRYETEDSNDDTLFLDGSNNYINGELIKEQANSSDNSYYLENTSENNLDYFELEGKTEQETRSGKNLLKYPYYATLPTTQAGVTWENDNGKIIASGTATGYSGFTLVRDIPVQANTNYRFYIVGTQTNVSIDISGTGLGINIPTTSLNNSGFVFNTGNATAITLNVKRQNSLPTSANFYPMLVIGTDTSTDYEPYGVMPSPDYPSELVSVGYENLLDYGTQKFTGFYQKYGLNIPAGTYTFSAKITSDDASQQVSRVYFYNSNGSLLGFINLDRDVRSSETITVNETIDRVTLYSSIDYASSNGKDATYEEVLLVKGNKTLPYIPYGKYGIEVKTTGKNFLYLGEKQASYNGASINISGNEITFNGNDSGASGFSFTGNRQAIYIPQNTQLTYSVSYKSGNVWSGGTFVIRLRLYYEDNTTENITSLAQVMTSNYKIQKSTTFIASKNISEIEFYGNTYNISGLNSPISFNLQLEKGTQATEYEEYKENTYLYTLDNPLRSIGDTKDLLYIKNGMLYVDRKIGSRIYNGTETEWTFSNGSAYPFRINIPDAEKLTQTQAVAPNVMVNYYTPFYWNISNKPDYGVTSSTNTILAFRNIDITSLADFKTWLSTHNTEVQYILAEPYTEEIGVIEVPKTYEETTYIDISSNMDTNTYLQYRESKTQVEAILGETNQFDIDSLKTGKILGNPAIDSYDLIQIHDTYKNKTYTTLATNDLVYTGVLINTFDTQIGEEAKEQNVFVNGEETFKKWARTTIDNVEGSINLQAGQINEANGRINEANLRIDKDGALLNVIANNSNIDIDYDSAGNPISGEVREVTTTTGFTFNAEGMTIEDTSSNFKAQHRNTGTYYKEGDSIVGQYTKDGSKQKDLELFGVYYYGKNDFPDTPMFIAQLYTDENGEEAFGHFYNRGD